MMKHPFVDAERHVVRFQDQSVVDRYHLRPTYPPQTFELLSDLIHDEPRAVLDIGCGTGNIARPLAAYVARIDAVDLSLPMLERARTLSGGDSPKIRWLHGKAEDLALEPPYALVTLPHFGGVPKETGDILQRGGAADEQRRAAQIHARVQAGSEATE